MGGLEADLADNDNSSLLTLNNPNSLTSIIEEAAQTIATKARTINRLLAWQRNPTYAKFVNDRLEIIEEFKGLIRDEYKEFSNIVRAAYSKGDIDLGYNVCDAVNRMFEDFLDFADDNRDYLFYHLGLAYFYSYQARFNLLDNEEKSARHAVRIAKRHYKKAIELDLDSKSKEKIERLLKKTEFYLKLYKPKKQLIPEIGINKEDIEDEKILHEKTQELYKRFPDLFDATFYPEDADDECQSYKEILEQYLEGKPLKECKKECEEDVA